jgi:serine/threonine-protein kinase
VADDLVISSDPEGGTEVERGTPVDLVVSTGEPYETVPDVSGKSEAEARALLTQADFPVGTVTTAVDTSIPDGAVLRSDPAPGTSASTCRPVTLTVADNVVVPDALGKTEADATDVLTKAGLKVTVSNEDECEIVDDMDPDAGTRVAPGSPVTIYLCGSNVSRSHRHSDPTVERHRS